MDQEKQSTTRAPFKSDEGFAMYDDEERHFSGADLRGGISVLAMLARESDRIVLARVAASGGWRLDFVANSREAMRAINRRHFAVVLFEDTLLGPEWENRLQEIASTPWHSSVVLASLSATNSFWEAVIHNGGYDVLAIPLRDEVAAKMVRSAWNFWKRCYARPSIGI